MVLVKLLERKDASSLIVAIAGGIIVSQLLLVLAGTFTNWLLDGDSVEMEFKTDILMPLVAFLVSVLLLEVLARLVIAVRGASKR